MLYQTGSSFTTSVAALSFCILVRLRLLASSIMWPGGAPSEPFVVSRDRIMGFGEVSGSQFVTCSSLVSSLSIMPVNLLQHHKTQERQGRKDWQVCDGFGVCYQTCKRTTMSPHTHKCDNQGCVKKCNTLSCSRSVETRRRPRSAPLAAACFRFQIEPTLTSHLEVGTGAAGTIKTTAQLFFESHVFCLLSRACCRLPSLARVGPDSRFVKRSSLPAFLSFLNLAFVCAGVFPRWFVCFDVV